MKKTKSKYYTLGARNLPILIGDPSNSMIHTGNLEARHSCHQWQHGCHIDSLPKEPAQNYVSGIDMGYSNERIVTS